MTGKDYKEKEDHLESIVTPIQDVVETIVLDTDNKSPECVGNMNVDFDSIALQEWMEAWSCKHVAFKPLLLQSISYLEVILTIIIIFNCTKLYLY